MAPVTRRRLRIFGLIGGSYALLFLPALVWPGYLDSPAGLVLVIPYLSIYFFSTLGIPGLLQNGGLCGWGWCAPSVFGWFFLVLVWTGLAWLLACGIEGLRSAPRA